MNSLLRLQTRHHIVVHQVRTREGFIKSLQMVAQKLEQDPYHLVMKPEDTILTPSLGKYKKSAHAEDTYWQDCLAIIPGVSYATATKITALYPNMSILVQEYTENPSVVIQKLSGLKINEKRKMGEKQAHKIIRFLFPPSLNQQKSNE